MYTHLSVHTHIPEEQLDVEVVIGGRLDEHDILRI